MKFSNNWYSAVPHAILERYGAIFGYRPTDITQNLQVPTQEQNSQTMEYSVHQENWTKFSDVIKLSYATSDQIVRSKFGEAWEPQKIPETLEPLDHISFQEQEENPSKEK